METDLSHKLCYIKDTYFGSFHTHQRSTVRTILVCSVTKKLSGTRKQLNIERVNKGTINVNFYVKTAQEIQEIRSL